ncbi:MAG: alpha/beta hydrolase [bacterium]
MRRVPGVDEDMSPDTGTVTIRGHRLYVERLGPPGGLPLVLLHHGLGSVGAWRDIAPLLAAAGFRVLAYDRWGYGRSDDRPSFDIPDFTDDLADLTALLEHEGMERAVLVGHSDGGTIALLWAAEDPGRVDAMVSVAAHAYIEPKMDDGIEGIRRRWDSDPRFRESLTAIHGPRAADLVEEWIGAWHRPENRGWDIRDRLGTVSSPVLVIQGTSDGHAAPHHARAIHAALPESRLWLPEGAGHMLPRERPGPLTERVLGFLSEVLPRDRRAGG